MKHFVFLTSIFLLVFQSKSFSQNVLSKGTLTLEITEVTSDNPDMQMHLNMMKGSKTVLTFDEDLQLNETTMMGGMMKIVVKTNLKTKMMDMLFSMMGNNSWIQSPLDDVKSQKEKDIAKETKVTYDKSKTKKILGYDCYQMTITNPEMEGMEITGYITDQVKAKGTLIQGFEDLSLTGYPLEFNVNNAGMKMTFSATSISPDVDASKFELNTTGYTKMTMKEFQESMGRMGRG